MIGAGAVGGAGIWATHFVAMLGFSPSLPINYNMPVTALSLLIGMAGAACGFGVSGTQRGRPLLGGALVGASVVVMHYSGLSAIRTAFAMHWNTVFVLASVILGLGFSSAALWVQRKWRGPRGQVGSACLLLSAIVGLHFTGMTAITLVPDMSATTSPELVSRPMLAVMVGVVVLLILLAASTLVIIEARSRRTSLNALQLAFQGVSSAIALYDPQGRLAVWNAAFATLMSTFGVAPNRGMKHDSLLGAATLGSDLGAPLPDGDAVGAHESTREGLLTDGRWLRVEHRTMPDGSLIAVLTDTTEQRSWVEAVKEARDKAEAASRAKSEFLANMSHEIRTPLNGVLGMLQAMERDMLEPRQRDRLQVANDSGKALLSVLNDILDHAKVESGQTTLEIEPFDSATLAASVTAAFSGAAASKGLVLDWQVDPVAAGWWAGDVLKLRQILSNLVANALKFTSIGGVSLRVAVEGQRLVFRILDTGIGIDPADAERLFEKFAQADESTTRKFGGTGLGLAICRGLSELMEGTVHVESQLTQGSCFVVSLPLKRADPPNQMIEEGAAADPTDFERPLSILVAEDNAVNQLVLRSLLEPLDVVLTIADDGEAAVKLFSEMRFDLVLMDIQMPRMNGVEATRAIRILEQRSGGIATPIVALTANVMPEQVKDYLAAGMNDYVAKPIEVERLYAVLNQVMQMSPDAKAA